MGKKSRFPSPFSNKENQFKANKILCVECLQPIEVYDKVVSIPSCQLKNKGPDKKKINFDDLR